MKQILSEKNIAAFLFIVVMVIFSLAHEDSKKRSGSYSATSGTEMPGNRTTPDNLLGKNLSKASPIQELPAVK